MRGALTLAEKSSYCSHAWPGNLLYSDISTNPAMHRMICQL